jgi:hypothetical protein
VVLQEKLAKKILEGRVLKEAAIHLKMKPSVLIATYRNLSLFMTAGEPNTAIALLTPYLFIFEL